ncbi:MAG: hypothetical protein K2P79_02610 [Sphingomonas sp.]|nr:hypothetical protein [Sphingomonas sp.]
MTNKVRIAALLLGPILLASCGGGDTDATGASASESRQLNEAAAMLDEDSVSANAVLGNDQAKDSQ